jgi:hypothetical protein
MRHRSKLESLSDARRSGVFDGAVTYARQGLRKPMVDLEHEGHRILNLRAGHRDQPGAPSGTQNGAQPGTSRRDGVELMARAINNRLSARTSAASGMEGRATAYKPKPTRGDAGALQPFPSVDAGTRIRRGGGGKITEDDPRWDPKKMGNRKGRRR